MNAMNKRTGRTAAAMILAAATAMAAAACKEDHYGFPTEEEQRRMDYQDCMPRTGRQVEAVEIMNEIEDSLNEMRHPGFKEHVLACREMRKKLHIVQEETQPDEFCLHPTAALSNTVELACPAQ